MQLLVASLCLIGAIGWALPAGPPVAAVPAAKPPPAARPPAARPPAPPAPRPINVESSALNFGVQGSTVGNNVLGRKVGLLGSLANQKLAVNNNFNFGIRTSNALSLIPSVPPPFPKSGRVRAVPEQESKPSMLDSAYTYAHQIIGGLFNRKPIVDTIQEHEKYGNDGDKYRSIGTAVVNSFEGLSNFLNSAVEVPFTVMKNISKQATAVLNSMGGKLVGL